MNALILIAGILSVILGYRMFCGFSRRLTHTIVGGLLAVIGMVAVVGQAKAFTTHKAQLTPASHRSSEWRNGSAPSMHRMKHLEFIA